MGALVVVAVVLAVAAVGIAVVNARARSAAEARATAAEARMYEAQAEQGALTVRVEELEAAHEVGVEVPADVAEPALTDSVTGLPGEAFFAASLNSRVAAARTS